MFCNRSDSARGFVKSVLVSIAALSFALIGTAFTPTIVHAATDSLLTTVQEIQKDDVARSKAIAEGKEQTVLCAYCHGENGNSTKSRIPNLANQNPAYLLAEFERFRTGARQDFTGVMAELVNNMSDANKVALAVYYANSPISPTASDPVMAARGKPVYEKYCQQCHGENGRGTKSYSWIAGQQTEYLVETLNVFRDPEHQYTRSRESDVMTAMTKLLSEDEIRSVAHYVTSMIRFGDDQ